MPDLDVLAADQGDVHLVGRAAMLEQFAGTTDAGMAAAEDDDALPAHDQRARRSAVRAPKNPHIPCTPPVGGVDDEQK